MRLFLVRWQHEYFYYNDAGYDARRQSRTRLVAAFEHLEDAQAHCAAISDGRVALPDGLNPFIGFRNLREGRHFIGIYREYDPHPDERQFFGLSNVTSLSEEELLAAIEHLRIAPPQRRKRSDVRRQKPGRGYPPTPLEYDWDEWWEASVAALPPWQRYSIFKLLDKVRLFEIVETDLEV